MGYRFPDVRSLVLWFLGKKVVKRGGVWFTGIMERGSEMAKEQRCSECGLVLEYHEVDGQMNGRCYTCAVENDYETHQYDGPACLEERD